MITWLCWPTYSIIHGMVTMKVFIQRICVALAFFSSVALADPPKNCTLLSGEEIHTKDEKSCLKRKGYIKLFKCTINFKGHIYTESAKTENDARANVLEACRKANNNSDKCPLPDCELKKKH